MKKEFCEVIRNVFNVISASIKGLFVKNNNDAQTKSHTKLDLSYGNKMKDDHLKKIYDDMAKEYALSTLQRVSDKNTPNKKRDVVFFYPVICHVSLKPTIFGLIKDWVLSVGGDILVETYNGVWIKADSGVLTELTK